MEFPSSTRLYFTKPCSCFSGASYSPIMASILYGVASTLYFFSKSSTKIIFGMLSSHNLLAFFPTSSATFIINFRILPSCSPLGSIFMLLPA